MQADYRDAPQSLTAQPRSTYSSQMNTHSQGGLAVVAGGLTMAG
jgi:hypothetical protein